MLSETPKPEVVSTTDPKYTIERKSPRWSLNADDLNALLRSLLLAVVGAVVTWIGTTFTPWVEEQMRNGEYAWAIGIVSATVAGVTVALNALRKLLTGTTEADG